MQTRSYDSVRPAGSAEFYAERSVGSRKRGPYESRAPSPEQHRAHSRLQGQLFIREPSFNKPADRHAAKQPQVPEEVSLLILLILKALLGIINIR